jgi:hypothetical protein
MRLVLSALVLVVLFVMTAGDAFADSHRIRRQMSEVDGSGVGGYVGLRQLADSGGTHISVVAFYLRPGERYVSLYYGNHTCTLEPSSVDHVIGDRYSANRRGAGTTAGRVEAQLREINSVSVRRASDFKLLACVDVHPEREDEEGHGSVY